MIIKRFNYILLQLKKPLKFYFSQIKYQNPQSFCNQRVNIVEPSQILSIALYDSKNNFKHYSYVRNIFQNALKTDSYTLNSNFNKGKDHRQFFHQTLQALSEYPLFQLDNQAFRKFYKLVNQNIHLKSNYFLENCLIFAILSDSQVQNSPIFIQFAKYYVKSFLQILKAKFSIDLTQENVINTIKLLFFRIFQKGFLPRQPGYQRILYINNKVKLLNTLIQNPNLYSSLLLKKVNFEYFMQIKDFFEKDMRQNIYHQKNTLLFEKIINILPVIVRAYENNINSIQHECKYLRQLYIKLFLVIDKPLLRNSIFFYSLVNKSQSNNQALLNQYLRKVEQSFKSIQNQFFKQQILKSQQNIDKNTQNKKLKFFKNYEILLILIHSFELKLEPKENQIFIDKFINNLSAVFLKKYTKDFLIFIEKLQNLKIPKKCLKQVLQVLYKHEIYEELNLASLAELSSQRLCLKDEQIKYAIVKSILQKDIKKIGNSELLSLLKTYINTKSQVSSSLNNLHEQNRQTLIIFILRFISDHHQTLTFDSQFQEILVKLFSIDQKQVSKNEFVSLNQKSFNDKQGNYPHNITQQLQNYIRKHMWRIRNNDLKERLKAIYEI